MSDYEELAHSPIAYTTFLADIKKDPQPTHNRPRNIFSAQTKTAAYVTSL